MRDAVLNFVMVYIVIFEWEAFVIKIVIVIKKKWKFGKIENKWWII